MTDRSPLVMIEIVIMLFIFTLSAAFGIWAFAWSDAQSKKTAEKDNALYAAQNSAELLKAHGTAAEVYYDKDWEETDGKNAEYMVVIETAKQDTDGNLLGEAKVSVKNAETGEEIYALPVAWQEGK